jgi:hypothetical protein
MLISGRSNIAPVLSHACAFELPGRIVLRTIEVSDVATARRGSNPARTLVI